MKKKFTLIVETNDDGTLNIIGENEGFNAFEVLGFLDLKRQDVLDQINDYLGQGAKFKRTVKRDGEIMEIEGKGEEK